MTGSTDPGGPPAGRVLRISERTVRKHLEHVYQKTGCHDRVLAVQWARDVGLTGVATAGAASRGR